MPWGITCKRVRDKTRKDQEIEMDLKSHERHLELRNIRIVFFHCKLQEYLGGMGEMPEQFERPHRQA